MDSDEVHRSKRILGEGRFGCVVEKVYVQEHPYACKIYSETEFDNYLLKEFNIQYPKLQHLRQHPNLLAVKYICDRDPREVPRTKVPWLLFELMETNLFQRISGDCAEELPISISLRILTEISDGLKYLHANDIVHKDLSSSSILLDNENHVKIGGFPFVQFPNRASSNKQAFMAPETMLASPQYGKPADVYSYACIALHLMSKELPKLPTSESDIHTLVQSHLGVTVPPTALQDKVLVPCLRNNLTDRPNIDEVTNMMKDIADTSTTKSIPVEKKEAVTIPDFYAKTFDSFPDSLALCWKDDKNDPWQSLTYSQYKKLIYNVSKSFVKLELKPQQSVVIQGFNSVEWFASYLGAVFAGGIPSGIHVTSSIETCRYILKDCKATIMVVRSQKLLNNIIKIRDKVPNLKAVVLYKGEITQNYPDIETYTWKGFLELGNDMEDSEIDKIIDKQKAEECAVLVYTSGTTGNPKGVMLSHDNLTWITEAIMDTLGYDLARKVLSAVVSYLPLAHIAGMLTDMFLPVAVGGTVHFAQPDALKSSLLDTLSEVQPTMFLGVPRLWEQIKDKLKEMSQMQPNSQITDIKRALGLTKCLYMFSAAAPMCPETLKFFERLGIIILELYGLCECTGPHTASLKGHGQDRWKIGSCGKSINGTQTKIINSDLYDKSKLLQIKSEHPVGEVMFYGRHIFLGYFKRENELVDKNGWLHSGDIGWMDKDGFLYVKCRAEDLITMKDGTKISPIEIEDCIKDKMSFLSNVMLIGNRRKHLMCLMTLKCIIDSDTGRATDALQPLVIAKFQELDASCTTVSQAVEDKTVYNAIQDGIDYYNTHLANLDDALKIHGWALLKTDFTIPGGELGPTFKLKRSEVERLYTKKIEELYKDDSHLITLKEDCFLSYPETKSETVGDYGTQIVFDKHNITITIPKGAIEKGILVEVTAAASFFASFRFPNEYHCISPYLWIGANYAFKQPFKVEMEHHAAVSQQKDLSRLCVMKAESKRDNFGNYAMCEVNDKLEWQFEIVSPHCTYYTKSKCTCLASKDKKMADNVAVYYFLPESYESDDDFSAKFCFCYNVKFCKQETENTYKKKKMLRKQCKTVSIRYDEEFCFDWKYTKETMDCGVSTEGNDKIKANRINLRLFKNEEDMKDSHDKDDPYPPYFEASVHCYKPSCLSDVQFVISSKKINTFFSLYLKPYTPELQTLAQPENSDPQTTEAIEAQGNNIVESVQPENSDPQSTEAIEAQD